MTTNCPELIFMSNFCYHDFFFPDDSCARLIVGPTVRTFSEFLNSPVTFV